ncbi:MAG TPA: lysyl oxidase family protein [Acidimicrobiales bacterium]|jgi:hypothetical protein|nr:lysyl oxidase family protein [Acidimicrobiales bacterium]
MTRRLLALALSCLALAAACSSGSAARPAPIEIRPPKDPRLPDLVIVPMDEFFVGNADDQTVLRFTTSIANTGAGPLIVTGDRPSSSSKEWSVVQWFTEADGSRSGVTVDGNMIFGGHGHDHWHLRFGATYWLYDDAGNQLKAITKAGFCFFDQIHVQRQRADTPAEAVFPSTGCGKKSSLEASMGLSVGWSDPYSWRLSDQSVDITDLPDGIYRLVARADPDGILRESNTQNNESWTRVRLSRQSDGLRVVEVVDTAPSAVTSPA